MNWMWIVILIPVVIWILSTVIRPPEEKPRRRFPPRDDERAEPRRGRPPGEVERFLEEINRLRRRTEGQSNQDVPSAPPETPKPVPRRVARPVVRPRPQRPPLEAPPVVRMPAPASAPPPLALPVEVGALEVVDVMPASRSPGLAALSTGILAQGSGSPAAAVKGMFRNPQTLAAAIVLHEVLGPPRCRRRRSF